MGEGENQYKPGVGEILGEIGRGLFERVGRSWKQYKKIVGGIEQENKEDLQVLREDLALVGSAATLPFVLPTAYRKTREIYSKVAKRSPGTGLVWILGGIGLGSIPAAFMLTSGNGEYLLYSNLASLGYEVYRNARQRLIERHEAERNSLESKVLE